MSYHRDFQPLCCSTLVCCKRSAGVVWKIILFHLIDLKIINYTLHKLEDHYMSLHIFLTFLFGGVPVNVIFNVKKIKYVLWLTKD